MYPSFCTAYCFGSRFLQITSFTIAVIPAICILEDSTSLTNWMRLVSKSAASADHSSIFLIFDGSRLIDCQLSRSFREFHELDYSGPTISIFLNISVSVNSILDIRSSVHPEILRILYCRQSLLSSSPWIFLLRPSSWLSHHLDYHDICYSSIP